MSVDLTKDDHSELAPINPYAVISLVAALLGLFPVAIVFGALAFLRPAGRRLAIAGLVIGVLEAIAVAVVVYSATGAFTVEDTTATTAYADYEYSSPTTSTTTVQPTTVEQDAPPATVPSPSAATEPSYTPETEAAAASVALGEYCSARGESAATTTGQTAYCSRLAGTDAYLWSLTDGTAPNPELQQIQTEEPDFTASPGEVCYDTDATIVDAQGQTLYCNATVNGRNAGNLVWQLLP